MRLVIYDNKPGTGLGSAGLRLSWKVWAWKQLQSKECDAVFAANSWGEAVSFALKQSEISWLQYWGHGTDGADALAVQALYATAGQSGSHRIVSALRAVESWIREGGAP